MSDLLIAPGNVLAPGEPLVNAVLGFDANGFLVQYEIVVGGPSLAAATEAGTAAGAVAGAAAGAAAAATINAAVAITGGTIDGATLGGTTRLPSVIATNLSTGSGTLNYDKTGTDGRTKRFLSSTTSLSGIPTAPDGFGAYAANALFVGGDSAQVSSYLDSFLVQHAVGGGGATGGRNAIRSRMAVVGLVSGFSDMVSNMSDGYSQANQGGTGGATTTIDDKYKGSLWAGNDNIWLANGATFYRGLYGREIDVSLKTGGSSYAKIGLFIVKGDTDAVRAVGDDAAIAVSDQAASSPGWKAGLQFGASWGNWPFQTDSKLISVVQRTAPTTETVPVAGYGIDFTNVTFTTAAIKTPGYTVSPGGNVTQTPPASVTPSVNGEMVFQATSNTSLTVKLKGTDGVVRSAVLTLA